MSEHERFRGVDVPDVSFRGLEEVALSTRCLIVAAAPTDENHRLVDRRLIERLKRGALVVLINRSHLVDFEALVAAANNEHIRVATDVFPVEPVPHEDALRRSRNIILSPHRGRRRGGPESGRGFRRPTALPRGGRLEHVARRCGGVGGHPEIRPLCGGAIQRPNPPS